MVFADTYFQPDAPDPVLDEETVLEAVRRHAPDASRLIAIDESGGEARAYHVEGDVVLKTQRPHRLRPRTNLEKEALFLGALEREGGFPTPRVLGYGRIEGIEYLCLTRMPGAAMKKTVVEPAQRAAALEELGRTLRRIHEIDQTLLTSGGLIPGDESAADLRTRFADSFDRLATALEERDDWKEAVDVRGLAVERLDVTPDDTPPVALHSNPGPEHTFVDPVDGSFRGLIDFGDAYRSHPALDLRPWAEEHDAESLLAGYRSLGPLPETFEQVWITGRVMMELARAARRISTPQDAAAAVERLLDR